ncbi:CPBP family intramembrane metalloprotease [Pontibacter sp. HSC-14F20]|uniref:CPBP family intramembrane glutamic endopeptidase n=1 Tax=Pontibacter sp. HSC-14F20 TaxID=2864136 RepID=UPI001C72E071|nr:CPBP family intramembrane glutamic endopeptidase [Pontibacter sp. HSC-14F20]MBX0333937.1 CPBP family intramembrane metalloprotease [Pontibacter sp. HSC-14F20]
MLHSFTLQLKQTVSDIWLFLKNPKDQPAAVSSRSIKLRILLYVLLIDVLLMFALTGIIELVEMIGWDTGNTHSVLEMMRSFPVWAFLLLGVLAVPLLEELIFRYGLRFKSGYMAFLAFVVVITLGSFAYSLLPLEGAIGVWVILGMALVLYALNGDAVTNFLEKVWNKVYGVFFYLVAFAFGLIHIANFTDFDYASAAVLLIPILIAPQVIGGMLMGYMRVKYGFLWGYFLHASHNALFFGLALATMSSFEKLDLQNVNYTLQVEEYVRHDQTALASKFMGPDSIGFENQKLHDVILALLDKEESLVELDKKRHPYTAIDLHFKTHAASKDIKQNKQLVLEQLQEVYKFDVTYRLQQMDAWDVAITDSSLLATNAVADIGKSTVMYNEEGITCENVTLGELVGAIEKNFKVGLIAKNDLLESGKYNFKLPKGDFEQAKEDLKTKYGILLQSRMELADLAVVSFK